MEDYATLQDERLALLVERDALRRDLAAERERAICRCIEFPCPCACHKPAPTEEPPFVTCYG